MGLVDRFAVAAARLDARLGRVGSKAQVMPYLLVLPWLGAPFGIVGICLGAGLAFVASLVLPGYGRRVLARGNDDVLGSAAQPD